MKRNLILCLVILGSLLAGCVVIPDTQPTPAATEGYPVPYTPEEERAPTATSFVPQAPTEEEATAEPTSPPQAEGSIVDTQPEVRIEPATPFAYSIQAGSPAYIPNLAYPEKGCNWMGVAGQVFDMQDKPVKNLVIIISGMLNGERVEKIALTGMSGYYGKEGYEIELAAQPVKTTKELTIQVFNLTGKALSGKIIFDTFGDCQKNLILINLRETGQWRQFFPLLFVPMR